MGEATVRFFDDLATRGRHQLATKYEGALRFDLTDGGRTDHWRVEIHHGDVTVSRDTYEADCVMHVKDDLFDRLAIGAENWIALLFRGAFVVEGDLQLFMEFRKLLPGQPGAHHPRDFARARRSPG